MSTTTASRNTSPETGAWCAHWPREPKERNERNEPNEPSAEVHAGCRCLCHRPDCLADYSACGGVATGTDVAERLRAKVRQPVSVLAHWIVGRNVVTFSCSAGLMLPLFQFDFDHGCVRSGTVAALSELAAVMTDDEVAQWFSRPNTWLNGAIPAQTLLTDVAAVLAAARADRFVAKG